MTSADGALPKSAPPPILPAVPAAEEDIFMGDPFEDGYLLEDPIFEEDFTSYDDGFFYYY